MSRTLTVTDDKVREAAAQCPDAKRVLTTLFPEVFAPKDFPAGTLVTYGGITGIILYSRCANVLRKEYQLPADHVVAICIAGGNIGYTYSWPAHLAKRVDAGSYVQVVSK